MNDVYQMCDKKLHNSFMKTDIQLDLLFLLEQVEHFLFDFLGGYLF